MLPALLHEGVLVEELFPIMTYICYHFAHEELLGVGLLQKVCMQYPGKGAGTHGGLQQFPPPYSEHPLRTS